MFSAGNDSSKPKVNYAVQHTLYLLRTYADCWPVSKQHYNTAHFMLAKVKHHEDAQNTGTELQTWLL